MIGKTARLLCPVCGYEEKPAPSHCGKAMAWKLEGSFRKREWMVCLVCGLRVEVPKHCGVTMWYSEGDYHDLPSPTPLDYESMQRAQEE